MRLSTLVGAGGLWYGFGKMIMDMCVRHVLSSWFWLTTRGDKVWTTHKRRRYPTSSQKYPLLFFPNPLLTCLFTDETFRGRLVEIIDQAQHFAALGPSGGGGPTGDSAQAFREGLDGTERERECPAYHGIFRST